MLCFLEHLLLDKNLVNPWADMRPATAELLGAFWVNPSRLEAAVWGEFPYEDDQAGTYRKQIIRNLPRNGKTDSKRKIIGGASCYIKR